jgi:hypothetical protein
LRESLTIKEIHPQGLVFTSERQRSTETQELSSVPLPGGAARRVPEAVTNRQGLAKGSTGSQRFGIIVVTVNQEQIDVVAGCHRRDGRRELCVTWSQGTPP